MRHIHRSDATGGPRRLRLATIALLGALLVLAIAANALHAQSGTRSFIDVVQVDGLLDPANADLVVSAIEDANDEGAALVVLQLDSRGAIDVEVDRMVRAIEESEVPVAVWVGPSGAAAKGAAALLLAAAPVASASQGSSVGPAQPLRLDRPTESDPAVLARVLAALSTANGRSAAGGRALAINRLSAEEARRAGAIDRVEPILGELIVALDGQVVETAGGSVTLDTADVVGEGADRRREPNQDVRFRQLGLAGSVVHTLTSPSIAYVLLVAGLALVVFEFFMASVGVAGLAGATSVVGAGVGFGHLPVQWWAVVLLVVAVVGFAIDVQAGRLGAWTIIGGVALLVGSIALYGGSAQLDVPWWVIVLTAIGLALFMVGALPAAIRARFSTPTIGRDAMVGEMGDAEVDVAPDGVVLVRGARWRARTNRATPIRAGDRVRVVAVEGLVLEVEPESGGARDYRERRSRTERA